jgi:hypothetical protein
MGRKDGRETRGLDGEAGVGKRVEDVRWHGDCENSELMFEILNVLIQLLGSLFVGSLKGVIPLLIVKM